MKNKRMKFFFVIIMTVAVSYNVSLSLKSEINFMDGNIEDLACSEASSFTGLQKYNANNGCYCINCPEGVPECRCTKR